MASELFIVRRCRLLCGSGTLGIVACGRGVCVSSLLPLCKFGCSDHVEEFMVTGAFKSAHGDALTPGLGELLHALFRTAGVTAGNSAVYTGDELLHALLTTAGAAAGKSAAYTGGLGLTGRSPI